jgi:hypothetical protein
MSANKSGALSFRYLHNIVGSFGLPIKLMALFRITASRPRKLNRLNAIVDEGRSALCACPELCDRHIRKLEIRSSRLACAIWPIRRNLVVWPPRKTLSDRDADAIAAAFHLASGEVGRRMVEGGD